MTISIEQGQIPEFTQGDRMRKARQLAGYTTREFALLIGVSQKSVTNAEGDHVKTRPIVLNAWALATGVPREWLETGHAPESTDGPEGGESGRRDSNSQHSAWKREGSTAVVRPLFGTKEDVTEERAA